MSSLNDCNVFLTDLFDKLGRRTVGYDCCNLPVELNGGKMIEVYSYAPDPVTFRDLYYYNSSTNTLYKRIVSDNRPHIGSLQAHWLRVSSF